MVSINLSVNVDELSEEIGEQLILSDDLDNREFFYLAALALECHDDDDYDATDVIMEFLRNSAAFEDVSLETCNEIEGLLR
jgi:hypothetical protein